jgi:hypothetical protein
VCAQVLLRHFFKRVAMLTVSSLYVPTYIQEFTPSSSITTQFLKERWANPIVCGITVGIILRSWLGCLSTSYRDCTLVCLLTDQQSTVSDKHTRGLRDLLVYQSE